MKTDDNPQPGNSDPALPEHDGTQANDAASAAAKVPLGRTGLLPEGYTWRSVLVEVVIVVAGVLVAFALNSWWQGRLASEREQAHLRALHADFQENVRRLEERIDTEQRTMKASRILLTLLKEDNAVPSDSTRRLLIDVFSSNRFQPVMGAYEALLGSGGLDLIRDDSLRTALATFTSMSENQYVTGLANEYYMDFTQSVIADLHSTGLFDPTSEIPVLERDGDLTPLFEHPSFRGHLAMRYYAERDIMWYYQQLLEQARTIHRRLETLTGD